MIFNYLFLNMGFDRFALQSEWMSNAQTKCNDSTSRALYYQYSECREIMAFKMVAFKRETDSVLGWVKSFLPGTQAYKTRSELGFQLQTAQQIALGFSLIYYTKKLDMKKHSDTERTPKPIQDKIFKPVVRPQFNKELTIPEANMFSSRGMGMWR